MRYFLLRGKNKEGNFLLLRYREVSESEVCPLCYKNTRLSCLNDDIVGYRYGVRI